MGDLTRNLSRSEFKCQCGKCEHAPVDVELPALIQDCADHFAHTERGRSMMFQRIAVYINSGYRCADHNKVVGGGLNSLHLYGMAADHHMEYVYGDGTRKKVPDDDIADYYDYRYPDTLGLGRYHGRTHVDTRKTRARWDER